MNVLGIETSCDETAAAVVRDGRKTLSSVVLTQTRLHQPYGGVVPEIASRSHVEFLPAAVEEAVEKSGVGWAGIDAVAATRGPGLATSLLVGLSMAKGLALRLNRPLLGVNHVEAHIYSIFLGEDAPSPEKLCPFIALVVSGGHTSLVRVEALGRYRLLGRTIDDAAGEAFDKGSNLLGLGYPGGPAIDKASTGGNPDFVRFPRGEQRKERLRTAWLNPELCFSFSGLKTALLYYLKENPIGKDAGKLASVAASYQEAIVDSLVARCDKAVNGCAALAAVGGVALNRRLREKLKALAERRKITLALAEPQYCADNAAMVAGLAGARKDLVAPESAMELDVDPNLTIGEETQSAA